MTDIVSAVDALRDALAFCGVTTDPRAVLAILHRNGYRISEAIDEGAADRRQAAAKRRRASA